MSEDALTPLRESIDSIDDQLIDLLNQRMGVAKQIGEIKRQQGAKVYVPSREEAIFKKLTAFNQGPLCDEHIRAIYREIFSASIALQREVVVAYLGPEATYTHQAARKALGSQFAMKPMSTIHEVFHAVEKGDADYGVVPIENSTEGAVFHSMDTLVESELKILSQVYLKIEHALMGQAEDWSAIEVVYSKDQALGQCRDWLRKHLPQARLESVDSTAQGVQLAGEDEKAAAIASALSGQLYGVPVLAEGIQDAVENITRFFVVGTEGMSSFAPDVKVRTSIIFSMADEVGALERALDCFSKRGINLSKIESRPNRKKAWEYIFFIDVEGAYEDVAVQEAVQDLRAQCPLVKWLGSYPV